MGDAAMTLPENPLGLQSFNELVEWTVSYLHFKHALEVIAFTPEAARSYLDRFSAFSSRYATEMKKQDILEAASPKRCGRASKPKTLTARFYGSCSTADQTADWACLAACNTAR